jgi:hypothetical protein
MPPCSCSQSTIPKLTTGINTSNKTLSYDTFAHRPFINPDHSPIDLRHGSIQAPTKEENASLTLCLHQPTQRRSHPTTINSIPQSQTPHNLNPSKSAPKNVHHDNPPPPHLPEPHPRYRRSPRMALQMRLGAASRPRLRVRRSRPRPQHRHRPRLPGPASTAIDV